MTIVLLDEGLHKLQFVKIKGPQYLWNTIKWNAVEQDTLVKVWKIVTTEKSIRWHDYLKDKGSGYETENDIHFKNLGIE